MKPIPNSTATPARTNSQHSAADESASSVATPRRSNARLTTRSFDDTVQVRHFYSTLPASLSDSGAEAVPLRNVAPLEGPRAGGRRRPQAAPAAAHPAPPAAAAAAPALSRWDASSPAQRAGAAGVAPPRRPAQGGAPVPAARAALTRSVSDSAPRAPARRPDPDDDSTST